VTVDSAYPGTNDNLQVSIQLDKLNKDREKKTSIFKIFSEAPDEVLKVINCLEEQSEPVIFDCTPVN
jgi:hypothetical protein